MDDTAGAVTPWETFDAEAVERLRQLASRDRAPSWTPEPGDELVGRLVETHMATTKTGERCRVATLQTVDGPSAVWLWHTALANQLRELKPRIGELVLIRFDGEGLTAKGHRVKNYSVAVDRPAGSSAEWDDDDSPRRSESPVPADIPVFTPDIPHASPTDDDIPF